MKTKWNWRFFHHTIIVIQIFYFLAGTKTHEQCEKSWLGSSNLWGRKIHWESDKTQEWASCGPVFNQTSGCQYTLGLWKGWFCILRDCNRLMTATQVYDYGFHSKWCYNLGRYRKAMSFLLKSINFVVTNTKKSLNFEFIQSFKHRNQLNNHN